MKLGYLLAATIPVAFAVASGSDEFDWNTIVPSWDLEYHDCYDHYQCARILLPLDWLNGTDTATVTIAITKLAAKVDARDPQFGGTIFAQPGGPGVSGTAYIRHRGPVLQDLVDIPGKKHYELVAFDPRGIGMSIPRINCFPGALGFARSAEAVGAGIVPASLAFAISAAKADYRQCEMIHGDFLSYVGTPNVARDMLALVDKIDELRRKEAESARRGENSGHLDLRSLHGRAAEPRLQYIGISYGTVLGNYFASTYPGRVGRLVLDGVADPYDWTQGIGWLRDTQDTDELVNIFFQGCFAAGPQLCALHRGTDTTWHDIDHRFWAWANHLDEQPLFNVSEDGTRTFVRSDNIRALFMMELYNAVFVSKGLAFDLDQAMRHNATPLLQRIADASFAQNPKTVCTDRGETTPWPLDPLRAVTCVDGANVTDLELSDWRTYVKQQISNSKLAGKIWASYRISCAGWSARPNWPFHGSFKTPQPSESVDSPESDRPAAPLLLLSNRWDPVTPLRNAQTVVKDHPVAGLVVQESIGHCATLNAVGPCLKNVLSTYFDSGVVPSDGTTCEPAHGPWDVRDSAWQRQAAASIALPWYL